MKKRSVVIILCIALLVMPLYGCAEETEKFVWTYAAEMTPDEPTNAGVMDMLHEVEERTDGRLTFKIYHSGSLLTTTEVLNAVESGVTQIGYVPSPVLFMRLPRTASFITAPYIYKDFDTVLPVVDEFLRDLLDEEIDEKGLDLKIPMWGLAPNVVTFYDREVKTLEDVEGLLVSVPGAGPASWVFDLGMAPVVLTRAEIYTAAEKGVVDAALSALGTFFDLKIYEVLPHALLDGSTPANCFPILMNRSRFEALPEDLQTILMDTAGEWEPIMRENVKNYSAEKLQWLEDNPETTIYELSEDETMRWMEAMGPPAWNELVAKYGDTALDFFEILKKYNPDMPYPS